MQLANKDYTNWYLGKKINKKRKDKRHPNYLKIIKLCCDASPKNKTKNKQKTQEKKRQNQLS